MVVCNKDQIGLVETGRGLCGIGEVNDGNVPVGDIADGAGAETENRSRTYFVSGFNGSCVMGMAGLPNWFNR